MARYNIRYNHRVAFIKKRSLSGE